MNVSLVICTYNRADSLRVTLGSLADLRVPSDLQWEVLVVDNNSSDHTREVVDAAASRVPCRYLFEARQGKSFALNAAVARAGGEVIAFTDDDVTMHPDWLARLWCAFSSHDCAGVGGRILAVWNQPKPRWYGESGPFRLMPGVLVRYDHGDAVKEVAMLPFGANMAFRRAVFTKYGPFNTDLGPVGHRLAVGEDSEFCQRIRDGGEVILYVPDAIVYHPVVPARARKQYFQSWYYRYGKWDVRREPPPREAIRWFGIPRWLFRSLASETFLWLTTTEPRKRFFHKASCYFVMGAMVECYRLTHRTD